STSALVVGTVSVTSVVTRMMGVGIEVSVGTGVGKGTLTHVGTSAPMVGTGVLTSNSGIHWRTSSCRSNTSGRASSSETRIVRTAMVGKKRHIARPNTKIATTYTIAS